MAREPESEPEPSPDAEDANGAPPPPPIRIKAEGACDETFIVLLEAVQQDIHRLGEGWNGDDSSPGMRASVEGMLRNSSLRLGTDGNAARRFLAGISRDISALFGALQSLRRDCSQSSDTAALEERFLALLEARERLGGMIIVAGMLAIWLAQAEDVVTRLQRTQSAAGYKVLRAEYGAVTYVLGSLMKAIRAISNNVSVTDALRDARVHFALSAHQAIITRWGTAKKTIAFGDALGEVLAVEAVLTALTWGVGKLLTILLRLAARGLRLPLGALLLRGRLAFSQGRRSMIWLSRTAHPLKHVVFPLKGQKMQDVLHFLLSEGRHTASAFRSHVAADFFTTRTLLANGQRIAAWLKTARPGTHSARLHIRSRFKAPVGAVASRSNPTVVRKAHEVNLVLEKTGRDQWHVVTVFLNP